MDSTLIAALIGAIVSAIGFGFAHFLQHRQFAVQREKLREEVTAELVRQRIKPYVIFLKKLEPMSSEHEEEIINNSEKVIEIAQVLQDAIYSEVGMLASNVTRGIIVYARKGCKAFAMSEIDFPMLKKHFWAIHNGLRSDLGISQSDWPDQIERIRREPDDSNQKIENLVIGIPEDQYR